MRKRRDFTIIELVLVLVVLPLLALYITNVVKLAKCDFEAPYKCEVIHGIGIAPPLFIVTAWFGTDED
jgi:hypothetical protein